MPALDPLTLEKWEPKQPLDTITARLLLASVRELFLTRLSFMRGIEAGRKPYKDAERKIAEDLRWVMDGRGREPYTLSTFCLVYRFSVREFRQAYFEADPDVMFELLKHWSEIY